MNRVLIDTNIVIDLLAMRKDFYEEAADLFSRADKKELVLAISA
ncbi:MAG TPA: PIN domain nuclease, partial [Aequorivita sp.]|nr:PIN domain nuclease [Aequorivita sp.]